MLLLKLLIFLLYSMNKRTRVNLKTKSVIQRGLREERVAKNPRYYIEKNNHFSYRQFKRELADYVDQEGRLYYRQDMDFVRTSTPLKKQRNGSDDIQLDFKLPPKVPAFPQFALSVYRIELEPLRNELSPKSVPIKQMFMSQGHRTGHVFVAQSDWNQ